MKSLFCLKAVVLLVCLSILGVFQACSSSVETVDPGQTSCTYNTECASNEICGDDDFCVVDPNGTDGDNTGNDGDIDGDKEDIIIDGDGDPMISAPEELDFGAARVLDSMTKPLEICNSGSATLKIRTIAFALDTTEFELVDYNPDEVINLNPQACRTFMVQLTLAYGHITNMPLLISSNATNKALWTTRLVSEYKGTSELSFDPEELLFGNVRVDDPGLALTMYACVTDNDDSGNKAVKITGIGFKYPSTVPHFQLQTDPEPNSQEPYYLNVGECWPITVTYDPTEATIWPEMHENDLVIYNDADNSTNDRSEVYISGSADQFSLKVTPNPVNFGESEIDATASNVLKIENQSGADLEVTDIRLNGNHCEEFGLILGDYSTFPFTIETDALITDMGVSYTPTNTGLDQGCIFIISYSQGDRNKTANTSVTGSGRFANEKPIAKISRSDNGSDISQPIEIPPNATSSQKKITLYGDISSDADGGYPLTYQWEFIKPDESNTVIWPSLTDPVITFEVDWAGPYTLSLVATDKEGLASDPKQILINVSSDEKIVIDMEFTGDGATNVNLMWHAPNGLVCSDGTMTSMRSCLLGTYGIAYVSNYTSQYDDGNKETIVHQGSDDGAYKFSVNYTENCPSWDTALGCLSGKETANVTIKLYFDMETTPRHTLYTTLNNKGDSDEWHINKVGGEWNDPTH